MNLPYSVPVGEGIICNYVIAFGQLRKAVACLNRMRVVKSVVTIEVYFAAPVIKIRPCSGYWFVAITRRKKIGTAETRIGIIDKYNINVAGITFSIIFCRRCRNQFNFFNIPCTDACQQLNHRINWHIGYFPVHHYNDAVFTINSDGVILPVHCYTRGFLQNIQSSTPGICNTVFYIDDHPVDLLLKHWYLNSHSDIF